MVKIVMLITYIFQLHHSFFFLIQLLISLHLLILAHAVMVLFRHLMVMDLMKSATMVIQTIWMVVKMTAHCRNHAAAQMNVLKANLAALTKIRSGNASFAVMDAIISNL